MTTNLSKDSDLPEFDPQLVRDAMMAMCLCPASELDLLSPAMFDFYQDDVKRVLAVARKAIAAQTAQAVTAISHAEVEAIYGAMNYLGDILNGMDAVEEEDIKATQPGFDAIRKLLAAPPTQAIAVEARNANNDLLTYVLQNDVHNRLTPRVIDIAYTAFMQAKQPNDEDGGASDWFTDTRPVVLKAIEKLRKDLLADAASSQGAKQ